MAVARPVRGPDMNLYVAGPPLSVDFNRGVEKVRAGVMV